MYIYTRKQCPPKAGFGPQGHHPGPKGPRPRQLGTPPRSLGPKIIWDLERGGASTGAVGRKPGKPWIGDGQIN